MGGFVGSMLILFENPWVFIKVWIIFKPQHAAWESHFVQL